MYAGLGMPTSQIIPWLLLNIVIYAIIYLIARGGVLWYFRINDIIDQLKITNALLSKLVGVSQSIPLEQIEAVRGYPQVLTNEEKGQMTKDWTQKDWDRFYETGIFRPHEPEPNEDAQK